MMTNSNITNFVKRSRDIMRDDAGINGDAQRIEQLAWLLFLKVYQDREDWWSMNDSNYHSVIPKPYQWHSWASNNKDSLTGPELIKFVNDKLFPALQNIPVTKQTPIRQAIIPDIFSNIHNYMQDGVLLRKLVNNVDALNLLSNRDNWAFNDIYEDILRNLQNAGSAGEFYTPRALTSFIAEQIHPKLGEKVADLAVGTGGFLTSALKILKPQEKTAHDREVYSHSVFGIEKKPFPYLLCVTNMLLHGIDDPDIIHGNSLSKNVTDYTDNDKFNVIMMNPPYGGNELKSIQNNFPYDMRSSETADLFIVLIMYRLKQNGRAGVVLPDGFLFSTGGAKKRIKQYLLDHFNLHTVIRLPHDIFNPYTNIRTNILFFNNDGPTKNTWFYRMDMPKGYKHFSKTRPLQLKHFKPVQQWWNHRKPITINKHPKAIKLSKDFIAKHHYSLDYAGFPQKEVKILPPKEEIARFEKANHDLTDQIERKLSAIKKELGATK